MQLSHKRHFGASLNYEAKAFLSDYDGRLIVPNDNGKMQNKFPDYDNFSIFLLISAFYVSPYGEEIKFKSHF